MGLPSGLTAKTVTFGLGTFANGDVVDGTVTITAPVNILHVPTGSPIFSSAMTQRLVNGQASFDLCPTDHPDLNRRDWTYTLVAKISGALKQPDPVSFLLPAAGADTVDLDTLVSVPSSAGTPVSVSAALLSGPNVFTGTQDFTGATVTGIAGGGGGVTSVAGQTGAVTGTQIAADPALKAAFASVGAADPGPGLPHGTEYVWMKTDGAGTLLDILSGVAS